MTDETELHALHRSVAQAVNQCQDPDLLDLVYKLLTRSEAAA